MSDDEPDDGFNSSFLSDIKETALDWLDSLKDPLERAKVIASRMQRIALLHRVSRITGHRLDKHGKQLLGVLKKEIESVPEGDITIPTINRLKVLETAVEAAEKMGVYSIPHVTDLNREMQLTRMQRADDRFRDLAWAIRELGNQKK